jgi:hypothetical protein
MTPVAGKSIGTIRLNVVDGRRQPVPDDLTMLVRALDGRKQQVALKFVQGPTIAIMGL